MAYTKQQIIDLLNEYLRVIKDNQVHYGKEDKHLGFNVKCYHYSDHEPIIEKYKEMYKDNEEVLELIKAIEKDIEYGGEYSYLWHYLDDSWRNAEEYFVQQCATYPKNYFINAWEENKCKHFHLINNKKTAIQIDKKQDKQRRAFDKIRELYQDGRSGGYLLLEYDFYMKPSEIEDTIGYLEDEYCTYYIKDFLYDYSIKKIKEDIEDIEFIAKEVNDYKNGVEQGWVGEVEFRIQEKLEELEELGE